MGRPKCYASPAARQAAYRQRVDAEMVLVNRKALTQWEDRVTRLVDALTQAARRGNPLALQVCCAHRDTTVEHLIAWFDTHGMEDVEWPADASRPSTAPARSALGLSETTTPTGGNNAPCHSRLNRASTGKNV